MKMSKAKTITALTAMALLLGGCGEAPYTLTESETDLIIHYASHVVTKFNTDQEKGLTYVMPDTAEDSDEAAQAPEAAEEAQTATESGAEEEASHEAAVSLTDLFGNENLAISYTGAYLTPDYAENSYYSMTAEPGKTFLALEFEITNSGAAEETIDCLSQKPSYQITVEDGKKFTSDLTLLMEDFSTYQATVPAGETQQAVLLFQIPDTYTQAPEFSMSISIGAESYQIAL